MTEAELQPFLGYFYGAAHKLGSPSAKASFQADYTLRYPDGRPPKRSSRRFKTMREAKVFIESTRIQHAEELYRLAHPDEQLNFDDLLERYYISRNQRVRVTTQRTRNSMIERLILPFFSGKEVHSITPFVVDQWHEFVRKQATEQPFSQTYLRSVHSRLSSIFNFAVENGWLKTNPAKTNSIGTKEAPERPVWSPEQYAIFRTAMEICPEAYYAFEVLYFTGLRLGELLGLTWQDIDFEHRTLSVNKQLQRIDGVDTITEPKTKKSNRIIQLNRNLLEELEDYRQSLGSPAESEHIFHITKSHLHDYLQKGIKLTGLPPITVHCFRHSHITNLIALGYAPTDIAHRVGHESIYITLHYAHSFETMESKIADSLDLLDTKMKEGGEAGGN